MMPLDSARRPGAAALLMASFALGCSGTDPESLRAEARAAAGRGDWGRAEALLSEIPSPTAADLVERSRAIAGQGRIEEALRILDTLPNEALGAGEGRIERGRLLLKLGRTRSAEAALKRALGDDPGSVPARRALIYLYGVQMRRPEYQEQFRQLDRIRPLDAESVVYWCRPGEMIGEPEQVVADLERFVAADPEDRASRLALARGLRRLGRLDEARRALEPLPAADPDALVLRVKLAMERGDPDEADRLLDGAPDDSPGLAALRGRRDLARGDAASASRQLQAAIDGGREDRETLFALVAALRLAGQADAAGLHAARAEALERRNILLQRVVLAGGAQDPVLLRDLGAASAELGEHAVARAWYRLALARDPTHRATQRALAELSDAVRSPVVGSR